MTAPPAADTSPNSLAAALALAQQAEQLARRGSFEQAKTLANRCLAIARASAYPQAAGWALMIHASIDYDSGRYTSAYAASREAIGLLGECGDVGRQVWALNICGGVFRACDDNATEVGLMRQGLRIATLPDHAAARCSILRNLAAVVYEAGEIREAVACMTEAMEIAAATPACQPMLPALSSQLAQHRLGFAEQRHGEGFVGEAAALRRSAAEGLPPLAPDAPMSMTNEVCYQLWFQIQARIALGDVRGARQAAATCIRYWRRSAEGLGSLERSLFLASEIHRHQGLLARCMKLLGRALDVARQTSNHAGTATYLANLAALHAQTGAHGHALALRRELSLHRDRQHRETRALRYRLAAVERDSERRQRQAREAAMHTQRLAIIGRLIAQTQHALTAPIMHIRQLTAEAVDDRRGGHGLRSLLAQVNRSADDAAGVINQLRLFSYRSAPAPAALSLHRELIGAWQGLHVHAELHGAELQITGEAEMHVWCDGQRLGIMFKLLLIELMQQAGARHTPVRLTARIDADEGGSKVLLHIEASRDTAPPPPTRAMHSSVGIELCEEVAAEMGGELQIICDAGLTRGCSLRLPRADFDSVGDHLPYPERLPSDVA